MLRRSFKFRLRPTVKQAQALASMLDDHRVMYNAALQERRDAWRRCRVTVTYGMQPAQLKAIRAFDSEQARWSFSSQQATLRRLSLAMQAFFRRVKAGHAPGYPRFKGRGSFDTVVWPSDGDGCRWNSTPDGPNTRVYLQGAGHLRVHAHRQVSGRVKTIAIKREGTAWYVIVSCDEVPARTLPATGRQIGMDLGVIEFAALSDGTLIGNPRWARTFADQLAQMQRAHSHRYPRSAPRSKRKARSAMRVAKAHRAIARRRLLFHHEQAAKLVREFDFIAHERLNISNMARAPMPRPHPETPGRFLPNGASAKGGLNKSILDAGWGQFLTIVAANAETLDG